jgi:hypothetical protein
MRGIVDPKLKLQDPYREDMRNSTCEKESHIAAKQIFALTKYPGWTTPTVKHHCPRTVMASSLRAISNRVTYDPKVFERFKIWFRMIYIPEFLKMLSKQMHKVDVHEWLKTTDYTKPQQAKLLESLKEPNFVEYDTYSGFTKVEMQFTTVPHEMKNDPLNDVKERQICGPNDLKKCLANPFIKILEDVAHKHNAHYCGKKNWIEICETIEKARDELPTLIFGAADGSGFDMTQLRVFNELMNELILAAARHPNIEWVEPLSVEGLMRALKNSLVLNVSMDSGRLKYTAEGRASGDGWTTFGNTMLMISYWRFTMYEASIDKFFLLVKGDDVLLGIEPEQMSKFNEARARIFTTDKSPKTHGLAQICKKIDFGDITDLDFLSNHFFYNNRGRLRMTRIPPRVIQTISWSTKVPPLMGEKYNDARRSLCYSKGLSLLAWGEGLCIWEKLARKMLQLGVQGRYKDHNVYSDQGRTWHSVDDRDAYAHYLHQRYNLSLKDIYSIELKIDRIQSINEVVEISELQNFFQI